MPLQASGVISVYDVRTYWATKGVAAATYDLNYYRAKAHYVGVMPSDSAANATFPASAISLAHFYNKTPVGEGAATNCNCDCNCGSGCGSTCFPAGSMVLMASGRWLEITQVRKGDRVMTPKGPASIVRTFSTVLGNRRLYTFAEDASMLWSQEHGFLSRDADGVPALWSVDPERLRSEADIFTGPLPETILAGREGEVADLAHVSGWVRRTPVIDTEAGVMPNLSLYLPMAEGGLPIIINGYLVNGDITPATVPSTSSWGAAATRTGAQEATCRAI